MASRTENPAKPAIRNQSSDFASPPRLQWSIKAILLLTTLVAIHLALLRAAPGLGALSLLFFFPVSLMFLARLLVRLSDRQIFQGTYYAFASLGGLFGAYFGMRLVSSAPGYGINILGTCVATSVMFVISAIVGSIYSMFIIAIYGGLVVTLKRYRIL